MNIFHQVFQCLQYRHLKAQKTSIILYRGKFYMKKFCESLREHAINIINFKKKKKNIDKRVAGII